MQVNGVGPGTDGASKQQIFYGRFVSTPDPDTLSIQLGAVLVTSSDGRGYISKTAMDLTSPQDAAAALGVGSDVEIVYATEDGFYFPGFIGTFAQLR